MRYLPGRRYRTSTKNFVSCLRERVWELQEVVVGQPQPAQRALKRWAEHLVSQGLEAVVRQL